VLSLWIALFGGGMVRLQPAGPKRLARGTPPEAADIWHLGCQAWALSRQWAPARAPGCSHLTLGLAKALACRHLVRGLPNLGC